MSADSAFLNRLETVVAGVRAYVAEAERAARSLCCPDGRTDAARLLTHQREAHGLAWTATLAEAIARSAWAARLARHDQLRDTETAVVTVGIAEYLSQLTTGIPMSQSEIFRPAELGLDQAAAALAGHDGVRWLIAEGGTPAARRVVVERYRDGVPASEALFDEDIDAIRDHFRRFVTDAITPHAHAWHLADELIPDAMVQDLAGLGVFGICIGTEHGGRTGTRGNVPRDRGAEPRLDCGRVARHPVGDCR